MSVSVVVVFLVLWCCFCRVCFGVLRAVAHGRVGLSPIACFYQQRTTPDFSNWKDSASAAVAADSTTLQHPPQTLRRAPQLCSTRRKLCGELRNSAASAANSAAPRNHEKYATDAYGSLLWSGEIFSSYVRRSYACSGIVVAVVAITFPTCYCCFVHIWIVFSFGSCWIDTAKTLSN